MPPPLRGVPPPPPAAPSEGVAAADARVRRPRVAAVRRRSGTLAGESGKAGQVAPTCPADKGSRQRKQSARSMHSCRMAGVIFGMPLVPGEAGGLPVPGDREPERSARMGARSSGERPASVKNAESAFLDRAGLVEAPRPPRLRSCCLWSVGGREVGLGGWRRSSNCSAAFSAAPYEAGVPAVHTPMRRLGRRPFLK